MDGIVNKQHQYHYHLVDMHTIDCAIFLKDNNPHAVVLAILCDFKGKDKRQVIRQVLTRIDQLIADNITQYNDCFLALEILSENRDLKDLIKEEAHMLSEIKLENLPSYEIAFERGEARGEAKVEAKIVQKMLTLFEDNKIHEITDIDLSVIKNIRKKCIPPL